MEIVYSNQGISILILRTKRTNLYKINACHLKHNSICSLTATSSINSEHNNFLYFRMEQCALQIKYQRLV